MPAQTDFNKSPYFDDFATSKGFQKILFKPGVAVQTRELNQLQSILQNQIEKFGDNIFKRGTIIEGCGLSYFSIFPYVKIKDSESDGTPVNVSSYRGLYVKSAVDIANNTGGLEAIIVTTLDGFESQTPNLNTLYVKYTNSGINGNTTSFSANQTLTVYDKSYPIFSYDINDGSSGFSNTDTVVVVSALAIQNSTGGSTFPGSAWVAGQIIRNNVANLEIVSVNATANSTALILQVKPVAADLLTANNILWKFNVGDTIRNHTTANTANVAGIVGASAGGSLLTDALGKITSIAVTNYGSGYYVPPYVTVSITSSNSAIDTGKINQFDCDAYNYRTNITVAESSKSPIGTGYGVKIAAGVVYQKGFFSRVLEQMIVVNKYSNTDFDASVGFTTEEEIVSSNQDQSLLDNASGTYNYSAPGADRLQLNPTLVVLDPIDAVANTDFLPIIEFTDGTPFRQRTQTVYSTIGDEMARRTYEESGNYVINQFLVSPKDDSQLANTASTFQVVVDPGIAYIKGYRVATTGNFTKNVNKATTSVNLPSATTRVSYGSYIRIENLGGIFQFNYGDTVSLYDTAKDYIAGNFSGTNAITVPGGSVIGTARMRSLLPGFNLNEYHLYLFDINMNAGKNFVDTKSVYYTDGATLYGVADTVLESSKTVLKDTSTQYSGLLVKNQTAAKSANGVTYTFRTQDTNKTSNSTGFITVTPGAGQQFPYSGTLTATQAREITVISKGNYQAQVNAVGTIQLGTTTPNAIGVGTSFLTAYRAGDYVKVANSTSNTVVRVLSVASNTLMILTANSPTTITAQSFLYYPNNVPVSLTRDNRSVVVEGNGSITISFGNTVADTAGTPTNMNLAVVYNLKETQTTIQAKSIKRGLFARIYTANNIARNVGPWPLGVSDVFRVRQILQANCTSIAATFNSETAVSNTADFITISNNKFANGDALLYNNTTGTSIGGIANNTTYYAVYANTTGFCLAASRNSTNINITAVSGGGTHTLTGIPLYFANGTNGAIDVTNDYYVDHKQNEDFLDTSHLVRKPGLPAISLAEGILVKFDSFTAADGLKTISSYNITDGVDISTMGNTSINTLEIPEVWGRNGNYYDLRDHYDFRPSAANTVPLIQEASNTSVVNPIVPVTKFTLSEKKFPVSDTDLTANVSYYVGRTDRVVVGINGAIDVIRGYDGSDEAPPPPNDTVTLQLLEIPPYPSLPKVMSPDIITIADTQVYNGKGSRRIFEYTVGTPIDENQRETLQVRNYKMQDIAAIEQRVTALEYYVSYTLAESIAKSKYIPSSLDSGNDRFKLGFFVDSFSNYNYAEVLDPEFNATIEDEQLTTAIIETVLEFKHETAPGGGKSLATIDFEEVTVFRQTEATWGAVYIPPVVDDRIVIDDPVIDNPVTGGEEPGPIVEWPPLPPAPVDPVIVTPTTDDPVIITSVVQQITSENKINKSSAWSTQGTSYEDWTFTMSQYTGIVEFYMNQRAVQNAVIVYQSTTPNGPWVEVTNSNSAEGVSQTDINTKGIANLKKNQGFYKPGVTFRTGTIVPGTSIFWFRDHQKILFTHDPANGLYYILRVYKGPITVKNGPTGQYEFKIFYPTDSISTRTISTTIPDTYMYVGEVIEINPPSSSVTGSNIGDPNNFQSWRSAGRKEAISDVELINNGSQTYWYTNGGSHFISVIGLKPNTYHDFMFEGIDATAKCTQIRTTTTNTTGLKTDDNGTLSFTFYNDLQIDWSTIQTEFAENQVRSGSTPSVVTFTLISADGNSAASGKIRIAAWLASPLSTEYHDILGGLGRFDGPIIF